MGTLTLSGAEDGVGEIARMRYVMHAEVEPENNISLVERLAIEVLGEIDDRVGSVVIVEGMGRMGLIVVINGRVQIVGGEAL